MAALHGRIRSGLAVTMFTTWMWRKTDSRVFGGGAQDNDGGHQNGDGTVFSIDWRWRMEYF